MRRSPVFLYICPSYIFIQLIDQDWFWSQSRNGLTPTNNPPHHQPRSVSTVSAPSIALLSKVSQLKKVSTPPATTNNPDHSQLTSALHIEVKYTPRKCCKMAFLLQIVKLCQTPHFKLLPAEASWKMGCLVDWMDLWVR